MFYNSAEVTPKYHLWKHSGTITLLPQSKFIIHWYELLFFITACICELSPQTRNHCADFYPFGNILSIKVFVSLILHELPKFAAKIQISVWLIRSRNTVGFYPSRLTSRPKNFYSPFTNNIGSTKTEDKRVIILLLLLVIFFVSHFHLVSECLIL